MLNLQWNGMTLGFVASMLEARVGRVVIDRMGLEGSYDFELTWPGEDRDAVAGVPQVGGAQTFLPAIEQQLGLRLDPARGMVDAHCGCHGAADARLIDKPPCEDSCAGRRGARSGASLS